MTNMSDDIIDSTIDTMNDDITDDITNSKRQSRIRLWAKKFGSCLRKCQPRRRQKASYLDTEPIPPPYRASITKHLPRHTLSVRTSKCKTENTEATNSKANITSSNWALPSHGKLQPTTRHNIRREKTIRLVNPSLNSLIGRRSVSQPTKFPRKSSGYTPREPDIHETSSEGDKPALGGPGQEPLPGPRSVLSWLDSFQTQKVFRRESPRPPTSRNDSAADLTIRPVETRPSHTDGLYGEISPLTSSAISTPAMMNNGARICHPPSIQSHVALNAILNENVKGWDEDWDKPLQHSIGGSKGLWKSASQRLLIRNKESIRRLNAEKAKKSREQERNQLGHQQPLQMGSVDSIQEMADEERVANEEWSGTWKAFDRAFGRAGTVVRQY
jgi:hypothetical protein